MKQDHNKKRDWQERNMGKTKFESDWKKPEKKLKMQCTLEILKGKNCFQAYSPSGNFFATNRTFKSVIAHNY